MAASEDAILIRGPEHRRLGARCLEAPEEASRAAEKGCDPAAVPRAVDECAEARLGGVASLGVSRDDGGHGIGRRPHFAVRARAVAMVMAMLRWHDLGVTYEKRRRRPVRRAQEGCGGATVALGVEEQIEARPHALAGAIVLRHLLAAAELAR